MNMGPPRRPVKRHSTPNSGKGYSLPGTTWQGRRWRKGISCFCPHSGKRKVGCQPTIRSSFTSDLLAGEYRLVVGVYDSESGERLPVSGGGDRVMDGAFLLGRVQVVGP